MVKKTTSPGFLSKVARFVRNPTVDWSDLASGDTGVQEEREVLKAALQRKRRNDRVRHRELNDLRELMVRQRAAAESTLPSQSPLSVSSAFRGDDKTRTIEQIARIEEQMAANWMQRQAGEVSPTGASIPARVAGAAASPAHLRARGRGRDSGPTTFPMTIDMVSEDLPMAGADWDVSLSHANLAEAAVRFANGQFDEAERALRALMVQEGLSSTARAAAVVLLDVLHARGDLDGFEEFAAEYAERFGVPVPRWPQQPLASGEAAVPTPASSELAGARWVCPSLLDATAVAALAEVVSQSAGPKWLDWTELVSADLAAARALLGLTEGWLDQSLDFRMRGSAVLRRRLKAGTPSGRQENEQVWWSLRLAMLRLMRRRDEFDLAALDYCVTYGVLPPDWREPVCLFRAAETWPEEAKGRADAVDVVLDLGLTVMPESVPELGQATVLGSETRFPALLDTRSGWSASQLETPGGVALTGYLLGDIAAALTALNAAKAVLMPGQRLTVDCRGLLRVDFAAAGSLLQWFMAEAGKGHRAEMQGVSPLIGSFFHVVGIDEAVTVRLRQY